MCAWYFYPRPATPSIMASFSGNTLETNEIPSSGPSSISSEHVGADIPRSTDFKEVASGTQAQQDYYNNWYAAWATLHDTTGNYALCQQNSDYGHHPIHIHSGQNYELYLPASLSSASPTPAHHPHSTSSPWFPGAACPAPPYGGTTMHLESFPPGPGPRSHANSCIDLDNSRFTPPVARDNLDGHFAVRCLWDGDCGAILEGAGVAEIRAHLRDLHGISGSDRNARLPCLWDGRCCRSSDLILANGMGKHIATCHLRTMRRSCQSCGQGFCRQDSLKRHEFLYCPGLRDAEMRKRARTERHERRIREGTPSSA